MKRKFLILTLCFTIFFTSLNYNKIYADGGIISGPMLATISTLAVGSGIVLNSSEDIIEFGNIFYQENKKNWQELNDVFNACVKIGVNGVVTVGKEFINKAQEFFNILKVTVDGSLGSVKTIGDFTIGADYKYGDYVKLGSEPYVFSDVYIYVSSLGKTVPMAIWINGTTTYPYVNYGYINDEGSNISLNRIQLGSVNSALKSTFSFLPASTDTVKEGMEYLLFRVNANGYKSYYNWFSSTSIQDVYTAPGTYDKDLINNNLNSDNSIDIYVPGNIDSLVGVNSDSIIYNPSNDLPYDLPINGSVTFPTVDNPSISIDSSISFPTVSDIPVDTPVENPNDTFFDVFPPWGAGIDFTPVTQSSFTDKFPFSLGSDIKSILDLFNVDPIAPKFTIPIVSEEIVLDLAEFNSLASIVRFFVLIGFVISLILITRKVIG